MIGKKPVDPFARRMVLGSFVYAGAMLVMFAVLTVIYLHTRPRCPDRVVAESISPDKRWAAAIMERRCGEESPFLAHVNLRPAAEEIHRGFFSGSATEGQVFLVEQDAAGAGLNVRWTSEGVLVVECPRCNPSFVREHEQRWKDVVVKFDLGFSL